MRLLHDGPIPSGVKARENPLVEELRAVALKHGVQFVGFAYPVGAGAAHALMIDNHEGDYEPGEVSRALRQTGVDLIETAAEVSRLPSEVES